MSRHGWIWRPRRARGRSASITLSEKPDLKSVPKPVRDKVSWDGKLNTLTISTPLTEDEAEVLKASVTSEAAAAAIVEAAEVSRTTAIEFFQNARRVGRAFRVPQLALRVQGELALFDPEVLEYPWDLSPYDAVPTADDLTALGAALKVSEGGEIDIDDGGHVVSRFLPDCSAIWALSINPKTGMGPHRHLVVPQSARAVADPRQQAGLCCRVAHRFAAREGFTLARANLQKFLIRNLVEARIQNCASRPLARLSSKRFLVTMRPRAWR
jgi:type III restriction enzyme